MKKYLALVLGAAFLSGVALAAAPSFEQVDENGDGQISREEAAKHDAVIKVFADADKDGNGTLSPDEYAAVAGQK